MVVDARSLGLPAVAPADRLKTIDRLKDFAAFENVRIKIVGLPSLSQEAFPFRDIHPLMKQFVDIFGASRLYWGSDWPNLRRLGSYAHQYSYLRECEGLNQTQVDAILGGTLSAMLAERGLVTGRALA